MSFITSKKFLVICAVLLFASPALVAMVDQSFSVEEERYHKEKDGVLRRFGDYVVVPASLGFGSTLYSVSCLGVFFFSRNAVVKAALQGFSYATGLLSCFYCGIVMGNCYRVCKDPKAIEPPLREVVEQSHQVASMSLSEV